jgi:hypothetical protein
MLSASASIGVSDANTYDAFLETLAVRGLPTDAPLFTTDTLHLWECYVDSFSIEESQTYNCRACRRFIETYGGLVRIDPQGNTVPAFWSMADDAPFSRALAVVVSRAKVTGVFLSGDAMFGAVPSQKGGATLAHLCCKNPHVHTHPLLSAYQATAEKAEDHKTLSRALSEFTLDTCRTALSLLSSDALYRSEKVEGVARWLVTLLETVAAHRKQRANLVWLAVATAPPGFCHVRSTMIGTLLEDIANGVAGDEVARRFAKKMNPLQYQRPTTQTEGNIAQAEKVIEKMGVAKALNRRFARINDCELLWKEGVDRTPPAGGIFAHLRDKTPPHSTNVTAPPITWTKFARVVLPSAIRMEVVLANARHFYAFTTAEDGEAPNMLQWHSPVAWYTYAGGASSAQFNLPGLTAHVLGVSMFPFMWASSDAFPHQDPGALFILKGCKDTTYRGGALFFPEQLRSEYHSIRSTLEAHARTAKLSGGDAPSQACGLAVRGGKGACATTVRVFDGHVTTTYTIDRWD